MAEQLAVSPLAHLKEALSAATVTGPRGVSLTELPFLTMVNVRVNPASEAAARMEKTLGVSLPRESGRTATSGPHTATWSGPDEWLVISSSEPAPLTADLKESLGTDPGSIVDLSANRTTLQLTGPSARAVLEKGCPLDLHPREFGPGRAVLTTVGPIPVLLWQVDDAPTYRLLPRASFADYLGRWLIDAMEEFGGPEVP
ncbi:sarcosine oxidase subunit gamma [Streptomyces acidiscabies]|uniref:Sarcosine oxidase subunit gamma n=1 Tax=Streptomyces acidiscabies TaxID=42234 RepID=A0A0L0K5U7_9ACTN|nr:sarcosine oxidase subunit gamma family protein [Streptomyces acidiscabies]MBP5941770.1 sarcosine oxidase subunit gamma [Streptomyces sp. LBUM 1476]KND33497.1 sarcosine oxidase subunit gamma [Streptomyces acidiscabies]MBZ3913190.1 sarcosine oxidase subunit gamma [Streptomyces acidiscabies]MDX2962885.1 sarcosine oxidase subunit gamma family protein [Streptomyces acidiscabies]MDX3021396.1 sarcosine oxidase subunit gamma family protein [Streptomyces acidiscabies]